MKRTGIALSWMLKIIGLPKGKYYNWKKRAGQLNRSNGHVPRDFWLEDWEKKAIIEYKKQHWEEGYRRLTYTMIDENVVAVSPATTYRVLRAANLTSHWNTKTSQTKGTGFEQPQKPHEHWHIDISYIKFQSMYVFLISVLDGYSRAVLHHDVRLHMQSYDVEQVLQQAFEKYPGVSPARRSAGGPRLISDNGSQFVAREFKAYLREIAFQHVRTSPYYPQSNGKIEAFHKNIKTECLRKESFLDLEELRDRVKTYIDYYNHQRLHSGIHYLPPQAMLDGTAESILNERDRKLQQARQRRKQNYRIRESQNEKSIEPEESVMASPVYALLVSG